MMLKKHTFSHFLAAAFIALFVSCGGNEDVNTGDRLVGTWQLKTVTVDGNSVDITGRRDLMQLQANFIYRACNTATPGTSTVRGGWSYQDEMLNISLDLPAAYYVLEVTSDALSLERFDFNGDGALQTTVLNYGKVADSSFPD